MHLCTDCQAIDWSERIQKERVHRKHGGLVKAHCPHCTHVGGALVILPFASHAMCKHCAEKRDECQACGGSTLPLGRHGAREAFEDLFDGFTALVKAYGITAARQLFTERRDCSGAFEEIQRFLEAELPHVDILLQLDLGEIDAVQPHRIYHYRLKRPIWTLVLGPLGFQLRPPHCASCHAPSRQAPAMIRAARCGHWTAGAEAAWCLPCAVMNRQCASCEASTE